MDYWEHYLSRESTRKWRPSDPYSHVSSRGFWGEAIVDRMQKHFELGIRVFNVVRSDSDETGQGLT